MQKRLDNYSPDLEKISIQSEKFYSSPELKTFSVVSNQNETVKVKLQFADAQKLLLQKVSNGSKQLTLLIKNTQTGAIVASSATASEKADQTGQVEAEFTFSNLDRAVKYELVSVNDYSRPDYLIFKDENNFKEDNSKSFVVNVDSIEVKNLVYSDIKQNSVKAEIYFDPIRDAYLADKQIEVEITPDGDPAAQLVTVDALAQSQTTTKKTVKIEKLDDGRLRAEITFDNLAEGKDFKIALLSLANKQDVQTNQENKISGPKFKIVNDFLESDAKAKSAEITAESNQKTLKFATDVVVSSIEFNPTDSTQSIDKQQSARIKVEFSNSNNEILKLKKDQLATLTLINKQTGKIVLASAKINAKESVAGQKAETSASVEFEFNNNLEKLTKYEVSSISVVRPNGIYSIPFAASIVAQPKTFVTQLTTVSVKNISYVDVSETSVELTVFFDSVNDDILNEQFEAELEYVLKTKDTELKKSSKVTVSNNQAVFTIDGLDEASTYEVKDLKLSKKVLARSTRSLGRRVRRSAPEASPVANNINVVFDKTEVEDKQKKFFSTKSLISEIKIDKTLLEQELKAKMPSLTLEQTNLTDTQAGIELKIKDPKQFFKDYVSGPKAASAESDIKLVVKSNRTGAISQAGAQISFDEASNVATVKFLLEDLEKYTVYSIVDIFVNGVRLGFLNTLTESQKEFATTARDVTPNYIAQTEFKRHGAVLRMVFDINKNWFLVNNKVRLTFKKFQAAGQDDPDLSVETTVDQDGLAVFRINKDNLAAKVPVGSRFEISKLEFIPDVDANQKVVKFFPLNTITSTDSTRTHSASQSSNLVPLARSRRSLSVFDSSSSGASQFQDNAQASPGQAGSVASPAAPAPAGSPADSPATLANTNFLNVNISTSPLQDPTVPASVPAPAVKTTFDTASFISAVEKVNLSGTNAELRITLNSTLLLDVQSPTIKLHYIDITDGKEHKADLIGGPAAGSSTSVYTFRASNLKTLNYYQIVSVNYADNNNAEQVIAFDDKSVKYEDKLFRTTPTSFSVKKIESAYNSSKKTANVKLTLDDQVAQYLENYTVRVSYQRIDKTNRSTTVSSVNGIINSDSTVSVELTDNYTNANQKTLIIPEASTRFSVDNQTNTLSSKPQNVEGSVSTEVKRIDPNKLFETYNYKITKVELVQKPSSTSGRAKRSVSTSSPNLVDFNSNYNSLATFDRSGNRAINETSIIQTSPIALYDQLIYVEEKDKFSGIDATIYAYFISSEDLSDQDRDKNNFRVQLYNESLKKYEQIRKASSIKKLNESRTQAGASHFYVATFETNLNKASLYNIEFFAYKDQKIELSEYKTNRVDKTQFTTPGKKAWLTNFSQVGAYQDTAANVIFQFDEKDEYLWRNKHKVELEITEKLDQPTTPPDRGAPRPSVTKFSFIPDGPISRVTIDNTSSQATSQASLSPSKTYEITKFTIKEATTPDSARALSTSNLKIKTVDARNQASPTTLGVGQMEVAQVDSVEVQNAPQNQKIPFFETKAQFSYQEATNFSQDDNTDADGRSATLEFTFNKHFLQIPKSFATITIIRSDAAPAAPAAGSAPGTSADRNEISFISQDRYDPTKGTVTFKLNNLDRFHTYDIKNFEIGGVKIDNLAASRNLKFTPTVQKIFLADLEVKDLKTGTTGSAGSGQTPGSGNAGNSGGLNPTKEDGSKVFGNVSLYFDNDNSFLEDATFEVKIKNKNDNTDVVTIPSLQVQRDNAKKATPYKVDIDLAQHAAGQIQPGTKIGFEFKLKSVSRDTDLKGRRPEDIVVAVPERQYNLDYAPILESEVIIPTVIESLVVSELKDTSAKLKIKLKGDPANFERVVNNPIVLSIQPDPNKQTTSKIPITLITQSQVTRFQDKSRFEIEYDLDNLVPNVEYKILKLQGQDLEIPFGEQDYRLKLEQPGSAQQNASSSAKIFKTPFTELSPERIILTQAPRNYTTTTTTPGKEYAPENLTLNLDPVSMWSLNNKTIKVKFKALDPAGKELTTGDNAAEKEYEFNVTYDASKKALVANLSNQQVTDAQDTNFYPSTTYKISQIKTVDADVSSQITLNLDDAQTTALPNTNNLEFTTQLAQPPLVKAGITNFYNHSGREDTFEQTIYFAFDDPYRAIDEASIKDWKLILVGSEDKDKGNNPQDASSWIQVAKYEPNFTDSFIELYNPRELAGPPTEYEEGPELQRLLIQQAEVDKQIQTIENRIKNFDQQDQIRINLIKELATSDNKKNYEAKLRRQGAEIKEAITQRLERLRQHRAQLDRIQVLTKYRSDVLKSSPHLTNPNSYRYFAFTLKGNASWLSYYKMRVAIQYKYFKDNESREASEFSKLITNINTNQTANGNKNIEAYTGSGGAGFAQQNAVSRIQTIELDDFAKYTNRILLKKSEIKPLNQVGAYVEMEFEDPKNLLAPLKNKFSKAQITGVSDLGNWVELSANIFFETQKTLIRDSTTPVRQALYKVDGSNDTGISNATNYNSFRRDSGFIYNLDFDLKGYDYDLSNPFASLLTTPNKEYIELTQQIPKTLEPRQQPKVNTTHEKFYAIRLAKVDVKGSKTTIGLIITYHWSNPQAFAKKIISIYPKLLNPNERWLPQNQHNDYEPLVPVFSPNVNLTFMTSPIIQKEDPYWGNFWANPSGNVWHGSQVRQFDKTRQQALIIDAFTRSLFEKTHRDFGTLNHDKTFFIGPTGPVKTLVTGNDNNPGMANQNIADQIYGIPYAQRNIENYLDELFKKQTRHPFGIKTATYDPAAKWLRIEFNNPENKIGFGVKLQEILPTVSYAAFVDQAGKIYLFGNKNGVPIKLQDDINVNDMTLWINLAPPNWSEQELPKPGTNLNFMGLLVFPYLPPNFTQNPALNQDVGQNKYVENQQYKNFNPGNGQPVHKYLFPVKGYDGLQVDAENPYFVPWVSHDKAWLRITY
ncbi:hypothetical protein R7X75_03370 [Mesomycoplasma ovipneumoniae]|uniref:hypothetical protein n=1 Tax=Mesomycoplasma ovipneumoniae TaxID=29562 RepID=UPI002964335B|nr:hypothetical protein [Mesomycoplasma ovipneumoniae]MDW2929457.1 hypothetical protein [Mesomycoplasma ovipneumoniae]